MVAAHTGQVDVDRRQSNWVGEESYHNGEALLVEDMIGESELAFVVHHTEAPVFSVVAAYCGACRCLDDRIGHQLAGEHKERLACHQEQRPQDHRCEWRTQRQLGRQSAP